MEIDDLYRAINSLRRGNSLVRRNNGMGSFSSSCRYKEDDEEALKWAALERLPTYDRLRKGVLTSSTGEANEVDTHNLGLQERKVLPDRLVKDAGDDHEKFLLKIKQRFDRVGIDTPATEVRFEHLNVEAEAYVGSRSLPTFFNYSVNILEGLLNHLHIISSRKKGLTILKDVSGIIKPSRSPKFRKDNPFVGFGRKVLSCSEGYNTYLLKSLLFSQGAKLELLFLVQFRFLVR